MATGKVRIAKSEIVTVMKINLFKNALKHFWINKIKKTITKICLAPKFSLKPPLRRHTLTNHKSTICQKQRKRKEKKDK